MALEYECKTCQAKFQRKTFIRWPEEELCDHCQAEDDRMIREAEKSDQWPDPTPKALDFNCRGVAKQIVVLRVRMAERLMHDSDYVTANMHKTDARELLKMERRLERMLKERYQGMDNLISAQDYIEIFMEVKLT